MRRLAPRLISTKDIYVLKSSPLVKLAGSNPLVHLLGDGAKILLEGATPAITLKHTEQTVSLRLDSSEQKISLPEWGGFLAWLRSGVYIPVAVAKQISEVSTTSPVELDRVYVLASSIPPNTQLVLFLIADIYNDSGYTTCIRATFSDATVELCTTSTSYETKSGSAVVSTLTDGWMVLEVSRIDGGTGYVKNACALLIPRVV